MKIDEFKKAIKGLIREEVKKIVSEEVSKAMGKVLVEMVKEIKMNDKKQKIVESSSPQTSFISTREVEEPQNPEPAIFYADRIAVGLLLVLRLMNRAGLRPRFFPSRR